VGGVGGGGGGGSVLVVVVIDVKNIPFNLVQVSISLDLCLSIEC
jgi:hypothetical protein